jgi:hypothetical protein
MTTLKKGLGALFTYFFSTLMNAYSTELQARIYECIAFNRTSGIGIHACK